MASMKKILIIEDDAIVSHIYRSRFEKEGFEVEVAEDGQTGYYRLYESKPAALLLDLMLPKLNGIDLLKKIRAVQDFEKLPVVVFTNAYVANMIHESFSAGASAVYNKSSVTPRQIIDVITTLLTPGASLPTLPATTPDVGAAKTPAVKTQGLISTVDDAAFQAELLSNFSQSSGPTLTEMRKLLQEVSKADEHSRPSIIEQLY